MGHPVSVEGTVPKPVFMGQSIPLKQVAEEGFLYTDDRS
jgi:hypothetical protein